MTQPTFPDRQTALEIWRQGINYCLCHDGAAPRPILEYHFHTLGIASTCEKIAALIPGMNPEKAWVMGLLHDYGKRHDERKGIHFHVRDGYEEMLKLGYTDVARVCLTHSFPKKDFDFAAYGCPREWLEWAKSELQTVEIDDYDRLVQMADFMFEGLSITSFENRAKSIVKRYRPKVPPTDLLKYAQENRAYFEAKINRDIYEILEVETAGSQHPKITEAGILLEVIIQKRNNSDYPFTPESETAFRAHCQTTAEIAATLAAAVDLCPDKAYVLGLLHDAGRFRDEVNEKVFHAVAGYQLLQLLDLPSAARISVTHCFYEPNFCPENYPQPPADLDFCKQFLATIQYDEYDRLIQLSNMLNYQGTICSLEQRFKGISDRYNLPCSRLQTEIETMQKVKGYFDSRCGFDIYAVLGLSEKE